MKDAERIEMKVLEVGKESFMVALWAVVAG
jgi:hypothetical protein